MIIKNKNNSFDFRSEPKKKYERIIYRCKEDDTWISVERPALQRP